MESERQRMGSEYFHQGYNCSQAVVMAFEDVIGVNKETLAKFSVGLGGGVGRMREVCGTVSGMAIVLGMLKGSDDPMAKNEVYPLIQEASRRFKEENGSIVCRELLAGVPHTDGGTAQQRTEEFYQKRPCDQLIEMAIGIVEEMLYMNNDKCSGFRIVPLTGDYPYMERILDIRDEAFPSNERIASRNVSAYNKENGFINLALEDNGVPVGFFQMYDCGDNGYYGIYLAIAKEFQNKHYGSRALKMLMEEYFKDKMLFGCVEALIPGRDNYQQCVDRVRFYKRNGIHVLDEVIDGGPRGKYQFVCTDPNMTFEQLKARMPFQIPSSN